MTRGYIQGYWPCLIVAATRAEVRVLIEGQPGAYTFAAWLVEPRRRR